MEPQKSNVEQTFDLFTPSLAIQDLLESFVLSYKKYLCWFAILDRFLTHYHLNFVFILFYLDWT